MGRYRKVDVRLWGDERVARLSTEPSGLLLWFHLLTGPHTTSIPGLSRAGENQLADALGWPTKAFREAFREVLREGLAKASWKDHIVWLPKAWKYNRPESPNVVRSWRVVWDELPECPLKDEAWRTLFEFTKGLGEAFRQAFAEACPQPLANPEQEQEQEQEQEGEGEGSGENQSLNGTSALRAAHNPKQVRLTRWPHDFGLGERERKFATDGGLDVEAEWGKFRDHHLAKGSRFVDWHRAWRKWCRTAVEYAEQRRMR